ncbi:D-alanyl-D-alanine carboxypeptidase/D-alanyl-D-alanine endopeptidase [Isoalcanivorax indicus]|uniref:D-alanyl-D-alanine carboxypeptidase/D-alanyl-D-alanine endopeptidase n=1 Tax=Isoalcanivorax indicus TaxID=2202653 RepID=UPI000DB9C35F|nr:D-alanyl-D-alanine carboxypeptidase/D-alanyl-D-alanine-endopeptidase [Isoalcanivorax indicus]
MTRLASLALLLCILGLTACTRHSALAVFDEVPMAYAAVPLDGPGRPMYQHADRPVNPASVMKLVTTQAALELLGPAFRWQTWLYTDGVQDGEVLRGNLYLVSGGDPALTRERLWSLLARLQARGIRRIEGDLVLDGSYFRLPETPPVFDDDGQNPYAPYLTKPDPLLAGFRLVQISAEAGYNGVQVAMEPALPSLVLDNRLRPGAAGQPCPRRGALIGVPEQGDDGIWRVPLRGELPPGCGVRRYHAPGATETYTADLVRALWTAQGGTLEGETRSGVLAAGSTLLAATSSPDLATLIRDINKHSNNVMTRQLFLTLGAQYRRADDSDDLAAARRVVGRWLAAQGIAEGVVLDNGSGLSRHERMSPRQLTTLLAYAHDSDWAPEFISSLPIMGVDGTMRLRGQNLAGQGRIKTGSLRDVRAIAGYVRDEAGTTWAVAAIINDEQAGAWQPQLDAWLHAVARPR